MWRNECLSKARELINGDRAEDYGPALQNHQRIANLWNAYLDMSGMDKSVSPIDVSMMMLLVKVARTMEHNKDDSFIDMCGYAALACEMSEEAGD